MIPNLVAQLAGLNFRHRTAGLLLLIAAGLGNIEVELLIRNFDPVNFANRIFVKKVGAGIVGAPFKYHQADKSEDQHDQGDQDEGRHLVDFRHHKAWFS